MFILSSRSATVLVIFIVACIAFCLASVFGAMTGPISISNDTDDGILDNLSDIINPNDTNDNSGSSNSHSNSHSNNNNPQTDDSDVETTTDDSDDKPSGNNHNNNNPGTSDDSNPNVETTTG